MRSALRDFIVEHRLPAKRIPTSKQLSSLGRLDLHQAIVHMGGYRAVATRLKWQSQRRPKGQFQDLDAVVGEIMKFATEEAGKGGGVVRMPTHGELRAAGRHDLRHALQLHGSKAVAEAAGLEMSRQGGRSRGRKGWVEALAAEVPVEKQEEGLSAGHG